ncbi:hypothetical protein J3B02_005381 [Coemansia erecta]|uniref:SNARE-complex protein Syntaxin-18 N-terminal domain-containing protein n=1 Tax=Coemansia asiatica TaxID=1052880 RepID=A0A9W7XJM0_9FUNG|nr:hypothetical protein LPJ64_003728 [Coemansia asiatica]KAJ2843083.1 hypothetical protein J3B02_005381 [Coemansia erecta]KAJ2882021.1 hypothetical protein FB639_002486 [Coemansia asiatica]
MDITKDFRKLVTQETAERQKDLPKSEKDTGRFDILPPRRPDFTQPAKNAFMAEAYIIAKHIQSLRVQIVEVRPAYLNLQQSRQHRAGLGRHGAARLSDPERDEIDQGIKLAIKQMLSKIQSLGQLADATLDKISDKEGEKADSARVLLKRLVGALDPRNAGKQSDSTADGSVLPLALSKRDIVAAHQSSVIWWLNSLLQKTNKVHAEMQELYLRQKLERQRGLVSRQQQQQQQQQKDVSPIKSGEAGRADSEQAQKDQEEMLSHLSQQELQMLQEENRSMLNQFESALDQVRETQRSLVEISTLQTQLANELNAQMQQTERLYNEAVGSLDAVGQGNEYLVSARKHQSGARKWVLIVFVVLSFVLLFLDWFD